MNMTPLSRLLVSRLFPLVLMLPTLADAIEQVEGISITGGSELPQVLYIVPWQPPSYQQRKQHPPEATLDGIIAPIEPVFHNEDHYFRKKLEVKLHSTAAE